MAIEEITPQQAHNIVTTEAGAIYIDVRTEREFSAGHPAGAVNIPVAFSDPARGMAMNPDFVAVVEKHFSKDKKIVVGCQSGPRSNTAAGLLQQAGYRDISSVIGGFGGMRDAVGHVVAPGWTAAGLPVSQDNGDGVSYQSLSAKAR
jgi:rhodanese-related sulfurtransferase